ncbi:CobW family GTP-binding protein [Billgrantia kenyensis]|uniref:GTP-binding protein n=1 Tax=Billgrantia kenyensis TaxID=321266 RepID=A0A7V9VXZ6_9GAMM|nr:CobW family GTP-binding protein [Halomonas kenyensis]MBA2777508.1 GTP-binding protein [Halomonas kenyensis]MCG6660178.1 GTP-binding protein [Halomonas kenyensis]
MAASPLAAVPVHLFTGFLGSGKTTLIRRLVEQKPEGERWAILINEFGQIGIDQAMFDEHDDVIIKGLPGGCLCCQLAFVLQATLVNLLHRHRPDRLIIEPSGLGHPAGLLDVLRGEAFVGVLDIRDIVVLLDPARLDDSRCREHETFNDQLAMADAVALTKVDLVTPEQMASAQRHVDSLWPPKKWVANAAQGNLPLSLLLEAGCHHEKEEQESWLSANHEALRGGGQQALLLEDFTAAIPSPGQPVQQAARALGYHTLGWRWSPVDVFDLDRLTQVLSELPRELRVKGVLHTNHGWKLYNRGDGLASITNSAWRRDSRLELIGPVEHLPTPEELLESLHGCCLAAEASASRI